MNHLKNLFNIFLVILFSAVIAACTGTPTPVNLAVKITGKGSIVSASNTINCKSTSGDCSENYTAITDETFTATADPGYYFSGWTAYKCAGVDTLCKLTISSALSDAANGLYTLQAEFKPTDSGLKNVTYTYNAMGQRNSKTVGGITTYFIYDLQGRVLAELDSQGRTVRDNVYLGPEQIATFSGGQPTYIFNDHLATPVLAVDASGHPVWTIETDPFGATKKIYRATDIAARFPGQYADEETGFNYNYFRDYDPSLGRYIQSDPIGLGGGINTYSYALQNPIKNSDFFGLVVQICSRPTNLDQVPEWFSRNIIPNHNWIKTDTKEAGMGGDCAVPGQGCADIPFVTKVKVKDHSGQSSQSGAMCETMNKVDEDCVNRELEIGKSLGTWNPYNQCQSFAWSVVTKCRTGTQF